MNNPFKGKEFKALKSEWDKKLSESGFNDIEEQDRRSGELLLIQWDSHYFQSRFHPTVFAIKEEYYSQANHFLHNYEFRTKTDRQVWKLHAEGLGVREIAKYLKERGVKTNKDYVAWRIQKLRDLMKEATLEECEKKTSLQLDLWNPLTDR